MKIYTVITFIGNTPEINNNYIKSFYNYEDARDYAKNLYNYGIIRGEYIIEENILE